MLNEVVDQNNFQSGHYDFRNISSFDEAWTKFEGEFYQDSKHGFGTYYLIDGSRF